jgi:hypothetical protein
MLKTFTTFIVLTLFGCSTNQTKTDKISTDTSSNLKFPVKPMFIESEDESMGGDIRLSFTESSTTDKAIIYKVNSTYDNKNIGFELSVPTHGLAKLSIKTDGVKSDNFLHALQKIYKLKVDTTSKFIDFISADCMNMGDYVDSFNKQSNGSYTSTAENKLFFQGKNEDDYAELYLNINDAEHWIELKEKDEEYRPIIVKLLTRH